MLLLKYFVLLKFTKSLHLIFEIAIEIVSFRRCKVVASAKRYSVVSRLLSFVNVCCCFYY
ncbi:MAG: hypothetical protein DCF13_06460 [Flavobacteriaceae bacterium]|nr:MAG: hypothetical protein DCF13_06460 [Flavobacteriaceae bacterium]